MGKSPSELTQLELKLAALRLTLNDIMYINDHDADYFETVVQDSRFLYNCYSNAKKLLVIDILKVVNPKENNNLISFVENLIKNFNDINWSHPVELSELQEILNKLNSIVAGDLYSRIKTLRDKHYAHDDKKKWNYSASISFDEINDLITDLFNIYKFVHYKLYNAQIRFDFGHYNRELHSLNKYNEIKKLVFEENKMHNNSINIARLLKIIRGQ